MEIRSADIDTLFVRGEATITTYLDTIPVAACQDMFFTWCSMWLIELDVAYRTNIKLILFIFNIIKLILFKLLRYEQCKSLSAITG